MAERPDQFPVIDKTLNVVYQRKALYKEPKKAPFYTERVRVDPRCSKIVIGITEQTLRKKIEVMRAEFERADDKSNLQFSKLVDAVERANTHEITAAKFVDKVESTMKCFNIDIYQKMYEKIMQNLPQEAIPATPSKVP